MPSGESHFARTPVHSFLSFLLLLASNACGPAIAPPPDAPASRPPLRIEACTSTPTITQETYGTGLDDRPSHDVQLEGFPALARDGEALLIDDFVEYVGSSALLWSVEDDREEARFAFPPDLDPTERAATVRRSIERGGFLSMQPIRVEATSTERCSAPCATYLEGLLVVQTSERAAAIRIEAPRRRLFVDHDEGGCVRGGEPTTPFRARAWIDGEHRVVLAEFAYEAILHGCETANAYTARRVVSAAGMDAGELRRTDPVPCVDQPTALGGARDVARSDRKAAR
jgi:hypothetical protein